MEDKILMYILDDDGNVIKATINLDYWVNDAFKTLEEHNIGCFTFTGQSSFSVNKLFLKDKPIKEIGFYPCYGSISGFVNHRELFDLDSLPFYVTDSILWLRYFEMYGGTLRYNRVFYTTKWFKTKGGLESLMGERKKLENLVKLREEDPLLKKYVADIKMIKDIDIPHYKYKTNPQVKRIHPGYKRIVF